MSKAFADKQLENAYKLYGRAIEKYCRIRLGEAADATDDCVQEAFLVYYRRLLNDEQFDNARAFLYKTANNMVLKAREEYIKNAGRTRELSEAQGVATEIEEDNRSDIDYDAVTGILISKLSKAEKELYQMKYVDKMSLREIGAVLSIPPSAVANRTSRLRTKIKGLVEPVLTEFMKGGS